MTSTGQGLPRRKKTASPAQTSIDGQYAVEASRGPVSRSLKATDFPSREDRQMPKPKRYAAGRARALGLPTRGTTNPYRLRRVDRHLAQVHADLLRTAATPLVIDLGSGEKPITAVELHLRLSEVRPDVQVVGLEIDPIGSLPPSPPPGTGSRSGTAASSWPACGPWSYAPSTFSGSTRRAPPTRPGPRSWRASKTRAC